MLEASISRKTEAGGCIVDVRRAFRHDEQQMFAAAVAIFPAWKVRRTWAATGIA